MIDIIKGAIEHLDDCVDALMNSDLGRHYFKSHDNTVLFLKEAIANNEIYVAIHDGKCVGFIYSIRGGIFKKFTYLHIIAVKENYRGQGIGKKLMSFFEDIAKKSADKAFLLVDSFNPDAKRLYESLGYVCVGTIPNLFEAETTDYLMMKKL